jgi:hypothetical protein
MGCAESLSADMDSVVRNFYTMSARLSKMTHCSWGIGEGGWEGYLLLDRAVEGNCPGLV